MTITRERFIAATGREPQDDDLERCNCDKAGQMGHLCCGWDEEADRPEFETMRQAIRASGIARENELLKRLRGAHRVIEPPK